MQKKDTSSQLAFSTYHLKPSVCMYNAGLYRNNYVAMSVTCAVGIRLVYHCLLACFLDIAASQFGRLCLNLVRG